MHTRTLLLALACTVVFVAGSAMSAPVHALAPPPAKALRSTDGAAIGLPHAHLMLAKPAGPDPDSPRGGFPVIGSFLGLGLPLQYGGGPVERTHTDYVIFWLPTGTVVSPKYTTLVPQFFKDVGGSTLFGTTTQYYDTLSGTTHISNAGSLGGTWTDTRAYTSGDLTDAEIQAEVLHAMSVNGWTGGPGSNFFVFTGPGAITPTGFCAYHSYFTSGGTDIKYANMLWGGNSGCSTSTSPNGDIIADSVVNVASHELWETITDPTIGPGWVALDGDEGSDQCNFIFGSTDTSGADTHMGGHGYIVQEEWSNASGLGLLGCTMG